MALLSGRKKLNPAAEMSFLDHLEALRLSCAEHSTLFAVCDTAAGLEECLFTVLPRVGLVR